MRLNEVLEPKTGIDENQTQSIIKPNKIDNTELQPDQKGMRLSDVLNENKAQSDRKVFLPERNILLSIPSNISDDEAEEMVRKINNEKRAGLSIKDRIAGLAQPLPEGEYIQPVREFEEAPYQLTKKMEEFKEYEKTRPLREKIITGVGGPIGGLITPYGRRTTKEGLGIIVEVWRRIQETVKSSIYQLQENKLDPTKRYTEDFGKTVAKAIKGERYTPGIKIMENMMAPNTLNNPEWILKHPIANFFAHLGGAWYETYGTDPVIWTAWAKSVSHSRKVGQFGRLLKAAGKQQSVIHDVAVSQSRKNAVELFKKYPTTKALQDEIRLLSEQGRIIKLTEPQIRDVSRKIISSWSRGVSIIKKGNISLDLKSPAKLLSAQPEGTFVAGKASEVAINNFFSKAKDELIRQSKIPSLGETLSKIEAEIPAKVMKEISNGLSGGLWSLSPSKQWAIDQALKKLSEEDLEKTIKAVEELKISKAIEVSDDEFFAPLETPLKPFVKLVEDKISPEQPLIEKGVPKELEGLAKEAGKYKTAEEWVRADFQKRVISGQDLVKEFKDNKGILNLNIGDGSVTIYHGTSAEKANAILKNKEIKPESFFSHAKNKALFGSRGADYYAYEKNIKGKILELKVDPRDIELLGSGELEASEGLILDKDGIWKAPNRTRTASQLTDIWKQAQATKGTVKPQIELTEELTIEEITPQQIQDKAIKAIKIKVKDFSNKKQFIDAIERGEFGLSPEVFAPYTVGDFIIDKEVASGLYDEAMKETVTEIGELKQKIYVISAVKGFSKAEMNRVIKEKVDKGSISNKNFTEDELTKVIDTLKKERPHTIGHKRVITIKTEKDIQIQKKNMIEQNEITPKAYNDVLKEMNISYPGYRSAFSFITESEGKNLMKTIRSLGIIYKPILEAEKAVSNIPPIKAYIDNIDEAYPETPITDVNTFYDAHHSYDNLELETKLPFGAFFEQIRKHRYQAEQNVSDITSDIFKDVENWHKIIKDKESMIRMQQYLGYKRPEYVRGKPDYPENITDDEKSIVDRMIKYGESVKDDIRFDRTMQWIKDKTYIPNAPERELKKAEEIYLRDGTEVLKEWLSGRDWGVITGGAYDFGEMIKPKIKLYKSKPGLSKKGLISKESIQYTPYDRDLITRFMSYARGITFRKHLREDVYAMKDLAEVARPRFNDEKKSLDGINRNLLEILGQRTETPQFLEKFLLSLYSQAARTIFFNLYRGIRNLMQNAAFYTSPEDLFKIKPLTGEDKDFFETYIKQERSIKYDYLYANHDMLKNIPVLKNLNELADMVNVMGKTDTINRSIAFKVKISVVKDALKRNPNYMESSKNFNKMMADAGLGDLTAMERKHALNALVVSGEEEFARRVAQAVVEKVHFLYTRFERGMMEQGNELSRVLSNLLTFRKGYIQDKVIDLKKLRAKRAPTEGPVKGKRRSIRSLIHKIIIGSIVGALFMKITGSKRNPYRPDSLIGGLSVGGLATGAQEQVGNFTYTLMGAATGDETALKRLPGIITSSADMFLPVYQEIVYVLEASTDTRYLDTKVLRNVVELIDREYEVRDINYERSRNLLEKLQHTIFGKITDKKERFTIK